MTTERLLRDLLDALVIDSMTSYVWLGQRFRIDPAGAGGAGEGRDALIAALEGRLYADFYCTGGVAPPDGVFDSAPQPSGTSTVNSLSAANRGQGRREAGWLAQGTDDGSIVVEGLGLRLWAEPSQVLPNGALTGPGEAVVVVLPNEAVGDPHGFYTAYGDAGSGQEAEGPGTDRFYWNVRPGGRVALVNLLTSRLNDDGLPFRLKVAREHAPRRCDAAVLYVPRSQRPACVAAVGAVFGATATSLRARTPVFAKRLAPGLAFAEDPPEDESFGTHRCGLLAEALVAGHESGARSTTDRVRAIAMRFAAAGLSLDRPFANPRSTDDGPAPLVG